MMHSHRPPPHPPIHVMPHSHGWTINRPGARRALAYITECDEAVEHARRIASRCAADLILHDNDGHIRQVVRRAEIDAPSLVERERSGRVIICPEEVTQPHSRAGASSKSEDRGDEPELEPAPGDLLLQL